MYHYECKGGQRGEERRGQVKRGEEMRGEMANQGTKVVEIGWQKGENMDNGLQRIRANGRLYKTLQKLADTPPDWGKQINHLQNT